MNKILLIGGTDPSGAGLQADWQVANHLGIHAHSVVTAVSSQNKNGVLDQGILPISQIKLQFHSINDETFIAIKIGMLGNADVIHTVVEFIQNQSNKPLVILDPVLASSSGGALLDENGKQTLITDLLPLITLITPNIHELEAIVNTTIKGNTDLEDAAQKLTSLGAKNVLVKGGHFDANDDNSSNDFFISIDGSANIKGEEDNFYLKGFRWKNKHNVRGTGCSLATTIACKLSQGFPLNDSIVYSKAFINNGIRHAITLTENQKKLQFTNDATNRPFELINMPRLVKHSSKLKQSYDFTSCDSKGSNKSLGIYPVVDSIEWLEKLIPLGIETIQLRIKDQTPEVLEDIIIEAIKIGHKHKIRLFINDYWQLAVKHAAYGIHLGQEDLDDADMSIIADSGCRLGVSTHSYTEVARALHIDPSYIALGPIFVTNSKDMPWTPQGVTAVKNWVDLLSKDYPLVAIGGINLARAKELKSIGIGSVAMISEITQSTDYKRTTKALLELWANS